jgi:hypothetical protein
MKLWKICSSDEVNSARNGGESGIRTPDLRIMIPSL